MDAFDCGSLVGNEVVSVIGCNADVVHILGTLIRLITLSRYSLMNLENADSALLRPCAKRLYAKVRLAKLKTN